MEKLGVAIVGVNGAVSSTLIAGVEMMKRGLAPKVGMVTEKESPSDGKLTDLLDFVPLEAIEFGGWDLQGANVHDAAVHHGVFTEEQLRPLRETLETIVPWPAVFSGEYAANARGENVVKVANFREEIATIQKHLEDFKKAKGLDRVVMVNLASTEKYLVLEDVHLTIEAFEKGLDENHPSIAPAMRYFYAAAKMGIPHANFAPSRSYIPALDALSHETGMPFCGMDGKTGQTLLKTTLAGMFRTRRLQVDGWYSVNFLGNNDGLILDSPESNKTKVLSKASVLDSIVGYRVENHQVHIHYYKPRGDAKEAWDNIDFTGFAGVPMQMKINFLCQDSILAAPLVVDMVRLLDVAKRKGERGIQRQLSLFFKSPYTAEGETPEHDLFRQETMLLDWAKKHADRSA